MRQYPGGAREVKGPWGLAAEKRLLSSCKKYRRPRITRMHANENPFEFGGTK
jgi:hypothetical protein